MRDVAVMKEAAVVKFFDSFDNSSRDNLIRQRGSLGILVLALPARLLQMSHRAWDLIRQIHDDELANGEGKSKTAKGLLPTALLQICRETFGHLQSRTTTKDWEQFEVRQIIGAPNNPMLIRGFGVPDRRGSEHARIIVILEALGRQEKESKRSEEHEQGNGEVNEQTKERFQFTDRQQEVAKCLARGWTNKEIATDLGIALPTVKEHVRHIMEKTESNTRTGVLMRILR
ncbi:MAG: response regulator transcription factor [Thermodesulfobacteriota bacterium]